MDTFGTHLVTQWHTSRYRRVLTGSNHHVNLHAGIDQGYSSRSGVRVGAPLLSYIHLST